jgi:hypothetical protein
VKNFDRVGTVDIEPIIELLPKLQDMWSLDKFRSSAPGTPHADTATITLRGPRFINMGTVFTDLSCVDWPILKFEALRKAIARVEHLTYAKAARVMLVNLFPGGHIARHIDQGNYAAMTERYHLCVTGNDDCVMNIEDENVCAKPEELWWFNKKAEHEVSNKGDTDRIHLIVDTWRD